MQKTYIHSTTLISPLGLTIDENWNAIMDGKSGVKNQSNPSILPVPFVAAIIPDEVITADFPLEITTKLEKMLFQVLEPIVKKHAVTSNSVLILSTTKGNISHLEQNNVSEAFLNITVDKLAKLFKIENTIVVSNACVSGVMAIGTAKRFLQMETYDQAYVIAGDVLTAFVVSGFHSFQALSDEVCKPYDAKRKGINIGEAAAACFVSKEYQEGCFEIFGEANHNDANHISGPSRTGEGLVRSIEAAMKEAKITSEDIDFISLHGTATLYNDEMEATALDRLKMNTIPCNSMKAYFGHTLGASGLVETILSMESIKRNILIPSKGFDSQGTTAKIEVIQEVKSQVMNCFLKTASGFGGSNSALILKKV